MTESSHQLKAETPINNPSKENLTEKAKRIKEKEKVRNLAEKVARAEKEKARKKEKTRVKIKNSIKVLERILNAVRQASSVESVTGAGELGTRRPSAGLNKLTINGKTDASAREGPRSGHFGERPE